MVLVNFSKVFKYVCLKITVLKIIAIASYFDILLIILKKDSKSSRSFFRDNIFINRIKNPFAHHSLFLCSCLWKALDLHTFLFTRYSFSFNALFFKTFKIFFLFFLLSANLKITFFILNLSCIYLIAISIKTSCNRCRSFFIYLSNLRIITTISNINCVSIIPFESLSKNTLHLCDTLARLNEEIFNF